MLQRRNVSTANPWEAAATVVAVDEEEEEAGEKEKEAQKPKTIGSRPVRTG